MKNFYRLGKFTLNDHEISVIATLLDMVPVDQLGNCQKALLKKFVTRGGEIEDIGTLDFEEACEFIQEWIR